MEALFFWIFALGLVASALAVILNRNPVTCAVCLVVTFVFLAGLFVTLEALFLAMVQIIVYAGAVMVLFLFIIMLLDLKAESRRPIPYLRIVLVGLLSGVCGLIFNRVLSSLPAGHKVLHWDDSVAKLNASDVGHLLFAEYQLPFEITAVLLLVATVGVILLSKRELQ